MTPTEKTQRKCYSVDEETFNCDSLEELIDDNGLEVGATYWEADAVEISHADNIDVHGILENMDERLYEEVGEIADCDYTDVPQEAKDELAALIAGWAAKHVNLRYWKVRNAKELKVTSEDAQ
jgi:hypothetical protein